MNVLDMILEEIEEVTFQEDAPVYVGDMEVDGYVRASRVEEIIRSHMNDVTDTNVGSKIPSEGTVKVQELIDKFKDMKERGTLLTGSSVTQEDIFIQIVGTIADVAMN